MPAKLVKEQILSTLKEIFGRSRKRATFLRSTGSCFSEKSFTLINIKLTEGTRKSIKTCKA